MRQEERQAVRKDITITTKIREEALRILETHPERASSPINIRTLDRQVFTETQTFITKSVIMKLSMIEAQDFTI